MTDQRSQPADDRHLKSQEMLKIAVELTDGDPTRVDLTCPYCGSGPLTYSYTLRAWAKGYGFYLLCRTCGHCSHYALAEKPPNYRDDLVQPEFQRLEDEAHLKI
jgi:hypothetical protein